MRIRIDFYLVLIRIRLFTLMRIRIQILASKMAQTLEKVLNRLIFHTFWLAICKLMRMRIRMRIQVTKTMRIRIHNTG